METGFGKQPDPESGVVPQWRAGQAPGWGSPGQVSGGQEVLRYCQVTGFQPSAHLEAQCSCSCPCSVLCPHPY